MAAYKDSLPSAGKNASSSERSVSVKNKDGRVSGGKYSAQCEDTEGNLPARKASKNAKLTYNPNEDVKGLKQQPGMETGAY